MGEAERDRFVVAVSGLALIALFGAGCATLDAGGESESKRATVAAAGVEHAGNDAKLHACYAEARAQQPELAVHTVALYFARDGKVVFADVELPESPQLARCLADGLLGSVAFVGPAGQPPGTLASGGRPIDLGPPLTTPAPRPTLADVRARWQRVTLEALQRGVLRDSDAVVREMMAPAPAWPTAEMRAELGRCHQEATKLHPGLVVHRDVIYLTRGGKVLLADVSIPEAPELQRCVLERITTWSSPFSGVSETVLSGFFIDLGGPEEFPDRPPQLRAEFARRAALVDRAVALGLINADDPLRKRFGHGPAESTRGAAAGNAPPPPQSD